MPATQSFPYRRAIVTFIDILGFREIVAQRSSDEIGEILEQLRGIASDGNEGVVLEAGLAASLAFSDSVVRVCPVDTQRKTGAVFYELLSLVFAQAHLAARGVFLRGGVTIGNIFFDQETKMIYGPALVKAYDLESNFAIYPRIVLDPELIKAHRLEPALRGGHTVSQDWAEISKLIKRGDDRLYFIDYLRGSQEDIEAEEGEFGGFLSRHRENIVHALSASKGFSGPKQKYFWLSNYHNEFVRNETPQTSHDELLINEPDLGK